MNNSPYAKRKQIPVVQCRVMLLLQKEEHSCRSGQAERDPESSSTQREAFMKVSLDWIPVCKRMTFKGFLR